MAESSSSELLDRIERIEQTLNQILRTMGAESGAKSGGESAEIELRDEEIDGIVEALDAVDDRLTERQRVYMLGILGAAANHFESQGGREGLHSNPRQVKISNVEAIRNVKLADGFAGLINVQRGGRGGLTGGGSGPLQDSVGGGVSVVCVGVDWSKDLDSQLNGAWRTNPAFSGGGAGGLAGGPQPGGGGGLAGLPGGFGR